MRNAHCFPHRHPIPMSAFRQLLRRRTVLRDRQVASIEAPPRTKSMQGVLYEGVWEPIEPNKGGPSARSCHPRWGWVVARADAWTKPHGRGRAGWGPANRRECDFPSTSKPTAGSATRQLKSRRRGRTRDTKDRGRDGTRQSKRRRGSEDGGSSGSQGVPHGEKPVTRR